MTDQPRTEEYWPTVSIVVIGRNEGRRLIDCLNSIRALDYPADKIELIYVDSNSTDNSCAEAEQLGATVIPITEGHLSAARGRNLGWRQARHELVHFFDGDVIVHPDWLKKAVAKIGEPGIGCVFGRLDEMRPQASIYMRVCSFDWHVPAGPWRLCGGIALFSRDMLERLGGLNEALIAGEEPELSYRLRQTGQLIWRLDEPMARHDLDMMHFGQYWKRTVRSGWAYCVVAYRCHRGPERFWIKENLVNAGEAIFWLTLLIACILYNQWWCWIGLVVLAALRVLRIAWKVRKRADRFSTALLYAGHCLFSRFPFFIGQLRGLWFLVTRRPAKIMEYNPASQSSSPRQEA